MRIIENGEPGLLNDLIAMAIRIDAAQYASYMDSKKETPPKPRPQSNNPFRKGGLYQMKPNDGVIPVTQLPGVQIKAEPVSGVRGKVSQAEKMRRALNKLCFYCGRPGHMASNCPHKPARVATMEKREEHKYEGLKYDEDFM